MRDQYIAKFHFTWPILPHRVLTLQLWLMAHGRQLRVVALEGTTFHLCQMTHLARFSAKEGAREYQTKKEYDSKNDIQKAAGNI